MRLSESGIELDDDGRAELLDDVLLSGSPEPVRAAISDARGGSGGELVWSGGRRPKFHSAYSSCALAVNVFAPWRLDASDLSLAGRRGFSSLRFEAKCPIFASRATPPNLDVLLERDGELLGVESKCTEYLGAHGAAQFSPRYAPKVGEVLDAPWRTMYERLVADPRTYRHLDAAQLVKHALGLRLSAGDRGARLLYLYWEPLNPDACVEFGVHRSEVADFASAVAGSELDFLAVSYPSLWRGWAAESLEDDALRRHVEALTARYAVTV